MGASEITRVLKSLQCNVFFYDDTFCRIVLHTVLNDFKTLVISVAPRINFLMNFRQKSFCYIHTLTHNFN